MARAGVLWWFSALLSSYLLVIMGVHKLTWKVGKVELHEPLYRRLDEFYLRSVEHLSEHLAEQLDKAHAALADGADGKALPPFKMPPVSPKLVKKTIGIIEILLALLWFTRRWRLAAFGSGVIMLCWLLISRQGFFWTRDDVPFAAALLCVSILGFASAPSAEIKAKQR